MAQNNNILQELRDLQSSLANIAVQNAYTVPAGYFEGLADLVLNRIKALEAGNAVEELGFLSPMLTGSSRQMPYTVPAGYFDELEKRLMTVVDESNQRLSSGLPAQTAEEELESISPLLSSLSKKMPFIVPEGYFETLSSGKKEQQEKTADHLTVVTETKIVSILNRQWFRYAAAAVITGMIALAGFFNNGNTKESGGKALARFTREVNTLNTTQQDKLIEIIDGGLNGRETAQVSITKPNDVKELLKDVSDQELKDFQEQTEDIEEVMMTN